MFAVLIDMQRAYDKLWREDLWVNLIEYLQSGAGYLDPQRHALYKESMACVRLQGV